MFLRASSVLEPNIHGNEVIPGNSCMHDSKLLVSRKTYIENCFFYQLKLLAHIETWTVEVRISYVPTVEVLKVGVPSMKFLFPVILVF